MKENENIRIKCSKVILVPYEACHVQKYHAWMESEELRELTASERLPLDEEYEMQKKWRLDNDKCTFIILDKNLYEGSQGDNCSREIEAMVGDVNIFFSSDSHAEGEVEIMIAESSARGRGFGKEALCCMMRYAHEQLHTSCFISKIGFENGASLQMFHSLGFHEMSRSDIFKEITLSLEVSKNNSFETYASNYLIEIIK
ncbi:N-acetyltransferase 9-like protein [Biomphalaria pfeifferi]|uniref:N-acetyltransferase 9-like protein n=1 Tax=Biomphalaria pfeifferi TaxID=112525 RepID=A0AAD8EZV8_BIOPF|nr:N-acetyltransferase 9-like protein [Biomphalaria pfeifferi]